MKTQLRPEGKSVLEKTIRMKRGGGLRVLLRWNGKPYLAQRPYVRLSKPGSRRSLLRGIVNGELIWDGLDAQRIFDNLTGELLIKPVKVGFAAFYEEIGRVGLVDECGKKGWKPIPISGRDVREALAAGKLPDARMMRESTAKILIDAKSKAAAG